MNDAVESVLKTPSMRLDGLTAVVTGGGRGLGRACALALAGAGAETVLVSRTQSELDAVAENHTLRRRDRVEPGVRRDRLRSSGCGDRCAGAGRHPGQQRGHEYPRTLPRRYRGPFRPDHDVERQGRLHGVPGRGQADGGRRTGGSIINMSSQMGHVGAPNRTVYCTSKHALEGMTKAMAVELAPNKIRVNSIGPTFILTPMTRPFFENQAFKEDTLSRIPLGELGSWRTSWARSCSSPRPPPD